MSTFCSAKMIINLLHIANSVTLRNNNYEGWLYFMIEGSWLPGKFLMVREKCLSSDRCFHLCSEICVSSAKFIS